MTHAHSELEPVEITIPEPLLRAAAAAERRTAAALDRVLIKLDVAGKGAALTVLIDHDRELNGRKGP